MPESAKASSSTRSVAKSTALHPLVGIVDGSIDGDPVIGPAVEVPAQKILAEADTSA
jgi:hypothetical protein